MTSKPAIPPPASGDAGGARGGAVGEHADVVAPSDVIEAQEDVEPPLTSR
jgi:hypothetical protein